MAKAKLLVADDEAYSREFLKVHLEEEGYEVTAVENGKKAIEAVKNNGYKVIFLDIVMPEMDGIEALAAIKKINPGVSVVMITAYEISDKIKKALEMGARFCLRKPFIIIEVIAAAERALKFYREA